jgi:hypothetical protein
MATVQLPNVEARLAFLAIQHHLARPGSELDPETGGPQEHGLAEIGRALERQLEQAAATVELSEHQRERLILAIAVAVNELKAYPLLAGGGSVAPGFDEVLQRLFPEGAEEPEEASQLVVHLVALRRRLADAALAPSAAGADPPSRSRPWWRFWWRGHR